MNIIYAIHQFFPDFYTGTERVALNLAKQMQRMGHNIRIITYDVKASKDGYQDLTDKVVWREYVYSGVPVTAVRHRDGQPSSSVILKDEALLKGLRELLVRQAVDLIHIFHPMTLSPLAEVAVENDIPMVLTLTDFWLMCPRTNLLTNDNGQCMGPGKSVKCVRDGCLGEDWQEFAQTRYDNAKKLVESVDVVVGPSEFLISVFNLNEFTGQAIRLVRHGVDYKVVFPSTRQYDKTSEVTFGFLGTIHPIKGVDLLAAAWSEVEERNARLNIYGEEFDAGYLGYIKNLVKGDERVTFKGKYEYEDIKDVMEEVDVVVIPSIVFESSSLVLSLALASKKAVIAPNIGGPMESIDNGINGYTVSPGDLRGLQQIISRIAKNPSILNDVMKGIVFPTRIEEEAFEYEKIYLGLA